MINFLSRPAPLLRVITVFLMAAFAAIRPAAANDGTAWLLAESSGNVHITTSGVSPVALTTGDLIGPGQRIVTDTVARIPSSSRRTASLRYRATPPAA